MFTPRARYRFYGTPDNYLTAGRHAVKAVLGRGQDWRAPLERAIAQRIGVDHAICMPQGRFGLYLILKHLLTPERPDVVMSPYTIHDVVNMVVCAGGRPVFADISPETCNVDADDVAGLIGARTGAVLITHLHGLAADVERIAELCRRAGVPMLEDAAQAFGARVGGRMLGSFGHAAIYSFGRAKNINAFFGGMVVTSDPALATAIRHELAGLPEEAPAKLAKRIVHCAIGDLMTVPPVFSPLTFRLFRYGAVKGVKAVNRIVQTENDPVRKTTVPEHYHRQMSSMQAELIHAQLAGVDAHNQARLEIARIYHEGLSGLGGIQLPPWRDDGSHIYLQYPIQLADRWDYVRYMMQHGRDLAIQHMGSAAELEIFAEFTRNCPRARAVAERLVLLPTYPRYGQDEARANVEVSRAYVRERGLDAIHAPPARGAATA